MLIPLFHLSVVVLNCFTLWYDQNYVKIPLPKEAEPFKHLPLNFRYLFLTIWCLVVQTIYFALAFLNDLIGTDEVCPKKTSRIRVLKDIFFGVAFPFAFLIAIIFWTIYALYKDLILPDNVEEIFPLWVNHVMHTLIVPFVIIELIITPKTFHSTFLGIAIGFFIGVAYMALLGVAFILSGTMVYPFFDAMNWKVMLGFVLTCYLLVLVVYLLSAELNHLIHGSGGIPEIRTKKVKRKAN